MSAERKPIRAHLTLIKLLIVIALLGGAGFLLVRGMQQAEERAQPQQLTAAMDIHDALSIKALLQTNPQLHSVKDYRGFTPLIWAAHFGHKDLAELLLAKSADVNAKDNNGGTPLYWASGLGHQDISKLLLANGADVHSKNKVGWTPLHGATYQEHKELAELLVVYGADVNAQDKDGKTPLHYAKEKGNQPLIEMLRAHGAKDE